MGGISIGNQAVSSEFFKELKLHKPLRQVQFQLFEKLASVN